MSAAPTTPIRLDWSGFEHWSHRRAACVHCGRPTRLRDAGDRPSHKVCAEQLIAARRPTTCRAASTRQEAAS